MGRKKSPYIKNGKSLHFYKLVLHMKIFEINLVFQMVVLVTLQKKKN